MGCEGLAASTGTVPWGALVWRPWRGLPLHRQPLTPPLCLSFPTSRVGAGCLAVPWAVEAAGKGLCSWEGGGGGLSGGWRRSVCVCVQPGGLCLWDAQGEGSAFPSRGLEAAFELVCAFSMGMW